MQRKGRDCDVCGELATVGLKVAEIGKRGIVFGDTYTTRDTGDIFIPSEIDLCGQACALKYFERWLATFGDKHTQEDTHDETAAL